MAKRYGGHTYSLAKKETLTLTRTHVKGGIHVADQLSTSLLRQQRSSPAR